MIVLTLFLAAIMGSIFFLSANQPVNNDPNKIEYVIGISQFNLNEQWLVEMNREIELAGANYPTIRLVFTDAGGNSKKQSQDIDLLLAYGIDLLMVSPNNPSTLSQQIAAVYDQIPVIIISRPVDTESYTTFISADNQKIGYEAGQFIAKLVNHEPTKILELVGSSESLESRERSKGFQASISQTDNLKIISTVEGDWLQDKAEDSLAEMYMDMPNMDVIFAHNDAMAVGAYNAALKMRLTKIRIIGIGGSADPSASIDLVRNGILECTFINTLGGRVAFETAMVILNHTGDVPKTIILDSQMITKDTLMKDERIQ
jgi:ABC-type sugar transport system substrate-binding protein